MIQRLTFIAGCVVGIISSIGWGVLGALSSGDNADDLSSAAHRFLMFALSTSTLSAVAMMLHSLTIRTLRAVEPSSAAAALDDHPCFGDGYLAGLAAQPGADPVPLHRGRR